MKNSTTKIAPVKEIVTTLIVVASIIGIAVYLVTNVCGLSF